MDDTARAELLKANQLLLEIRGRDQAEKARQKRTELAQNGLPSLSDSPSPEPIPAGVCDFCKQAIPPQVLEMGGKVRYFPGYCKCEGAEASREKIKEEERRQALLEKAGELIAKAGIARGKLNRYRFSAWRDDQYPRADEYKNQVAQYVNQVAPGGRNLLFIFGSYGVGKSHLAVAALRQCILNHISDQIPWRGYFCDWVEHCSLVQESWGNSSEDEGQLWAKMRNAHILVIDDIDKRKPSEWALGKLFEVIQHRYYHEKPTIITANHSIQELQKLWGESKAEHIRDAGSAILSRVMEQLWRQIGIKAKDQRDSL